MTVSNEDLFRAILAMDAYNRGYDAGLKLSNNTTRRRDNRRLSRRRTSESRGFFCSSLYLGQQDDHLIPRN